MYSFYRQEGAYRVSTSLYERSEHPLMLTPSYENSLSFPLGFSIREVGRGGGLALNDRRERLYVYKGIRKPVKLNYTHIL